MVTVSVRERPKRERESIDDPESRRSPESSEHERESNVTQLSRQIEVPHQLAELPEHAAEWLELPERDRQVLSPAVLDRWTRTLLPEDYTLIDLVKAERKRRANLKTLRAGDLTDMAWKMYRFLLRNENKIMTYLQIARHLWSTPERKVTAAMIRRDHSYASPMISSIWVLAHEIRYKMEVDPLRPQFLATHRGIGYALMSRPPSLDDGIDYEARAEQAAELREMVRAEIGLTEGEYATIETETGRTVMVRPSEEGYEEVAETNALPAPSDSIDSEP